MAELDKITQQVIDKEKKSLDEKVEKARAEAEEAIQAAKDNAEAERAKQVERINQETSAQYDIEANSIAINERNQKLSIKQDYIEQVLQETQAKLDAVDEETFKNFAQGVLSRFEGEGKLTVILGEKSQSLIDEAWLKNVSVPGLDLDLGSETVPEESGFVLSGQGVEYNYLFSELIDNAKNDFVRQINQELFT